MNMCSEMMPLINPNCITDAFLACLSQNNHLDLQLLNTLGQEVEFAVAEYLRAFK